jgi:hypothetical protein
MSPQSRLVAGILLVLLPSVEIGGALASSRYLLVTLSTPRMTSVKTSGELATQAFGWCGPALRRRGKPFREDEVGCEVSLPGSCAIDAFSFLLDRALC